MGVYLGGLVSVLRGIDGVYVVKLSFMVVCGGGDFCENASKKAKNWEKIAQLAYV